MFRILLAMVVLSALCGMAAAQEQGRPERSVDDIAADIFNRPTLDQTVCEATLQRLFIRRDRMDISIYNADFGKDLAEGGGFSASDDKAEDNLRSGRIDGVATYVVARDPCVRDPDYRAGELAISGYAIAPWVLADGNLRQLDDEEDSDLRAGLDAQIEVFSGPLFNLNYVTLAPYYQTDFSGDAEIYGFSASWTPVQVKWNLNARRKLHNSSPWISWFWQLEGEVDALSVEEAGLTGLTSGTDYFWAGGTLQFRALLLPKFARERLYAVAELQAFADLNSDRTANLFEIELGFNLTQDGSTSISAEYRNGTERATLLETDLVAATLNYKY